MDRMREWVRAVFLGLIWAAAMEAVSALIDGGPVDFGRLVASAPVWVWFALLLGRRRASGRCARSRAPA